MQASLRTILLTRPELYSRVEYVARSESCLEIDICADCDVVASALESGIRGSVQLLLELGLVDEAKEITKTFMARWISI